MPPRTRRAAKTRPEPPDLAPRRDPAPAVLEPGAFWDGVDAGSEVEAADHVADLTLQESRWVGAHLSGRRLSGLRCRDVEFVQCDLSGAILEDAVLRRVAFVDCRLTGIVLAGAALTDVTITSGHADLLGLRMARATNLLVEDASMRGADLYGFAATGCAFLRCDLTEAVFDGSRLDGVRLHGSRLVGVQGALSLRGARIGPDQVVELGAALLDAVGVAVEPT